MKHKIKSLGASIPAVIYSKNCDDYLYVDDIEMAEEYSRKAKRCNIIATVLWLIGILVTIGYIVFLIVYLQQSLRPK